MRPVFNKWTGRHQSQLRRSDKAITRGDMETKRLAKQSVEQSTESCTEQFELSRHDGIVSTHVGNEANGWHDDENCPVSNEEIIRVEKLFTVDSDNSQA